MTLSNTIRALGPIFHDFQAMAIACAASGSDEEFIQEPEMAIPTTAEPTKRSVKTQALIKGRSISNICFYNYTNSFL